MCLYPKLIKNPKYKETKKNRGVIPPVTDIRVLYVPIGCQECIECRKKKAREWQIRLQEDIKTNTNGKFITLTFSNESYYDLINNTENIKELEPLRTLTGYKLDNELATRAIRLFLERWRKEHKKSLRHWLITELGHKGTENIHLHGIVWTNESFETIERIWKYGFIWPTKDWRKDNYVSARTVNYITKYVTKQDEDHKTYKSRILTSPGIGGNYINTYDAGKNKYNGTNTREVYRTNTGHEIILPIYYRNKIYNEEQKEQLWLQKLDKEERWVCGERIDVKEGFEQYIGILNWYRQKSKQLGYGDGVHTWQEKEYEKQLREIKQQTRLKKVSDEYKFKGVLIDGTPYNLNELQEAPF